jgi:hypothetical protein
MAEPMKMHTIVEVDPNVIILRGKHAGIRLRMLKQCNAHQISGNAKYFVDFIALKTLRFVSYPTLPPQPPIDRERNSEIITFIF